MRLWLCFGGGLVGFGDEGSFGDEMVDDRWKERKIFGRGGGGEGKDGWWLMGWRGLGREA